MNKQDEFSESWKHALGEGHVTPPEHVWDSIESELDGGNKGSRLKPIVFFFTLAAASLFIFMAYGFSLYLMDFKTEVAPLGSNDLGKQEPKASEALPFLDGRKEDHNNAIQDGNYGAEWDKLVYQKDHSSAAGLSPMLWAKGIEVVALPIRNNGQPTNVALEPTYVPNSIFNLYSKKSSGKSNQKFLSFDWTSAKNVAQYNDYDFSAIQNGGSNPINFDGLMNSGVSKGSFYGMLLSSNVPDGGVIEQKMAATKTYGLKVGTAISERFNLYTGIEYKRTTIHGQGVLMVENEGGNEVFSAFTKNNTSNLSIVDPYAVTREATFVSIPMEVGMRIINKNNLSLELIGGLSTDLFVDGKISSATQEVNNSQKETGLYKKASLHANIGMGLAYTVGDKYKISITPSFKKALTGVTKVNTEISNKPSYVNLGVNLAYMFN